MYQRYLISLITCLYNPDLSTEVLTAYSEELVVRTRLIFAKLLMNGKRLTYTLPINLIKMRVIVMHFTNIYVQFACLLLKLDENYMVTYWIMVLLP